MGVFVRSVGCAFALVRLLLTYSYLLLLHQIFCIAICCDSYCLSPVFSFIDRLTVGLLPCIGYPALVPGPIQHARATLQLPSPGMLKHRSRTISHCPRSVLCWWLYFTGFLLPLSKAAPSTTRLNQIRVGALRGRGRARGKTRCAARRWAALRMGSRCDLAAAPWVRPIAHYTG